MNSVEGTNTSYTEEDKSDKDKDIGNPAGGRGHDSLYAGPDDDSLCSKHN